MILSHDLDLIKTEKKIKREYYEYSKHQIILPRRTPKNTFPTRFAQNNKDKDNNSKVHGIMSLFILFYLGILKASILTLHTQSKMMYSKRIWFFCPKIL